jgi:hypothetical protein
MKHEKNGFVKYAESQPAYMQYCISMVEGNIAEAKTQEDIEYWEYQLYLLKNMKGVING